MRPYIGVRRAASWIAAATAAVAVAGAMAACGPTRVTPMAPATSSTVTSTSATPRAAASQSATAQNGAAAKAAPTNGPDNNAQTATNPASPVRIVDDRKPSADGSAVVTVRETFDCRATGQPVSEVYYENSAGGDPLPYAGDVQLGDYSQDKVVTVVHNVLPGQSYRISLGCGYLSTGDNEVLYECKMADFLPNPGHVYMVDGENPEGAPACWVDGKRRPLLP